MSTSNIEKSVFHISSQEKKVSELSGMTNENKYINIPDNSWKSYLNERISEFYKENTGSEGVLLKLRAEFVQIYSQKDINDDNPTVEKPNESKELKECSNSNEGNVFPVINGVVCFPVEYHEEYNTGFNNHGGYEEQ